MAEQVRFDILVDDLGSKVLRDFSRNVKKHVGSSMQTMWKLEQLLGRTETKTKSLGAAFRNLDTAGANRLTQRLKTAEGQMDRLISKAGKLHQVLGANGVSPAGGGAGAGARGRVGLGMVGIGALSGYLAPAAAVAGLTSMVRLGADLESQLVDIRAILSTTDGFSGQAFDSLMKNMRQLGADTIFTTKDVYGATKYMAMAGLNIEQIDKSMKSVTSIAAISDMKLDHAADIITNIQTSYGIAAANMDNVADVLARTLTSSNVNMEELGEAFKYAGNEAARSGIRFNEMAAAIGVLGNNGIKASMAGTNLRQMMIRMKAPTAQAQKVLDKYNYSFKEVVDGKTRLKDLNTIVKDVNSLGMSAEDLKHLFGVYGGTAFGALSTARDEQGNLLLETLTEKNDNAAGIADKMADQKMKTFRGTLARLDAQFELLSDNLFQRTSPAITQVMNLLINGLQWLNQEGNPVLNGITTAFNVMGNVLSGVYNFVKENKSALGELFKILAAGLVLFQVYRTTVALVTAAQATWNAAMLANPIGLVVAGVVGLAAGFMYLWNKSERFRGTLLGVWEMLKAFGNDVKKLFNIVWEEGKLLFEKLSDFISKILEPVKGAINSIKGWFSSGSKTVKVKTEDRNRPIMRDLYHFNKGYEKAQNDGGKIDLFGGLTKAFKLPKLEDIGNQFNPTGDTSSNIGVNLGGASAGEDGGSGSGDASVRSFKGEKSTTGGLVINVQTLFSVQTETLLKSLGDDGMAIRDELVRQFTAIVKDVELSHGA